MRRLKEDVLAQLKSDLGDAKSALEEAVEQFNNRVGELFDELVAPALTTLNEKRGDAASQVREWADDAQAYFDDRTDSWQEGERGQEYAEWKDALAAAADNLDNEIEIEKPDDVVTVDLDPDPVEAVDELAPAPGEV